MRSSTISARRSAPERVRDGATELSLYRRDASNMEGSTSVVCLPTSTADVQACVRAANRHGVPFVARGSGTGLAGGAVPLDGAVVIATTKMNDVLSVDPVNRQAWVEPGVLNLDLSRHVDAHGLHFAPDPSSQQTCSIGGNVANNSGGPHCLADGVTASHVLAIEVVLPDGTVTMLGGEDPEPDGYDLRGVFVGSEGMFGIATKVCVKLTPNPPTVQTLLMDFDERRGRRGDGERHHRRRHGARRGRDDGPVVPRGPSRRTSTPGCRSTPPRRCSSRSSACPHGVDADVATDRSDSPRSQRCGTVRIAARTTPSGRCSGRGASRRSARSPASSRTTTSTTRSSRAASCRRC